MRHEQLRRLLTAQPFSPFTIHLPEGRTVEVFHYDFAMVSPDGRTLVVYDRDGVADIIDVMLIASIRVGPPPAPSNTTPANNGPNNP